MKYDAKFIDDYLSATIPLYSMMGFHAESFDGKSLVMDARLAPNINDKGTAFGGSIYSLAVLAGWAFVILNLRNEGLDNQLVIQKSDIEYKRPLTGDFSAIVRVAEEKSLGTFFEEVREKRKGSLSVVVEVAGAEKMAALFRGTYYAI